MDVPDRGRCHDRQDRKNIDLLAARRVQLRINRALTERDRLGL